MSTFSSQLRSALSASKDAKDASREAGQGVFANYVRSVCYPSTPSSVEVLDSYHKALVEELDNMRELTKEEKNSLRSAKSVIGKAITNNVDVWQRDDAGLIVYEDGVPMPKGKSELQEAKTDFQRLMSFIEQATKKWESDTRDVFNDDEMRQLSVAYGELAHAMIEARNAQ